MGRCAIFSLRDRLKAIKRTIRQPGNIASLKSKKSLSEHWARPSIRASADNPAIAPAQRGVYAISSVWLCRQFDVGAHAIIVFRTRPGSSLADSLEHFRVGLEQVAPKRKKRHRRGSGLVEVALATSKKKHGRAVSPADARESQQKLAFGFPGAHPPVVLAGFFNHHHGLSDDGRRIGWGKRPFAVGLLDAIQERIVEPQAKASGYFLILFLMMMRSGL